VEIPIGTFQGKKKIRRSPRSLGGGNFHILQRCDSHDNDIGVELILNNNPAVAVASTDRRDDMLSLCGRLTVPQIFFNETPVGGSNDLTALLEQWDDSGPLLDSDEEEDAAARNENEEAGRILKNSRIWRKYQQLVASQPDPVDPRLALPAPLRYTGPGSSTDLSGMARESNSSEEGDETEAAVGEDFGCINLPDGTCASVREVVTDLVENMPRQKLAYLAKFYNDCFQGDKGVDALLKIYPFEREGQDVEVARSKAVAFGRVLQRYGILHHVCNDHPFEDTGAYYFRLQPFHQPHVLNSFQSLHRVIENMPKDQALSKSFAKPEEEHSDPVVLTPGGALQLLTKLQRLLTSIESRNTERDGIDFTACKNYEDPEFVLLEEESCQLQCMDAMALASGMSDDEKMVFGIHLYNIMVRHAYIKVGVPLKDNQRGAFFTGVCYNVGNQILSLDDVEHGMIRANTRHPYHMHKQFVGEDPRRAWAVTELDPRIHFTLFCGANSCPPINSYTPENLESELQLAAEAFCQEDSNVLLDETTNTMHLSMLFKWYRNDFGVNNHRVLAAKILTYLPKRGDKYKALSRMFAKKSGTFSGGIRNSGASSSPTRGNKKSKQNEIKNKQKDIKVKFIPYDWGSKAAPGKCLEFKSGVLKSKAMSLKAPFSKTATAFTGGGCVPPT